MLFVDTHCHFDFLPFTGNEAESLQRASLAGVSKIIVPAIESARFASVLSLADNYPPLYGALGLHPVFIDRHTDADVLQLEQYLRQSPQKLIAIGEIGLDCFIPEPQLDKQQHLLVQQLRLACQYPLPVILHSRRSHDLLLMHLRKMNLPRRGVVHGFSGSLQQAQGFINAGYAIGVGGVITYPRANKTRAVMAQLPLDFLLLETDAPDMPLQGYQGQPNRPERVAEIWQVLCQLRPEPPELIAATLRNNVRRIFAI